MMSMAVVWLQNQLPSHPFSTIKRNAKRSAFSVRFGEIRVGYYYRTSVCILPGVSTGCIVIPVYETPSAAIESVSREKNNSV